MVLDADVVNTLTLETPLIEIAEATVAVDVTVPVEVKEDNNADI